jgi:septation ring formation regulator EzrA
MLTEEISKRLNEILNTMNQSETNLEEFYELLEKETGGKITFTNIKNSVDKYYAHMNKSSI